MGRHDHRLHSASRSTATELTKSAMALRSMERTQPRLLGRQTRSNHLLRALRPHRSRHQESQQPPSRRRPIHRSGRVGRRFPRTLQAEHIPVDFVSTHVYADDTAEDVFGTLRSVPRDRMVCRAARKVHDEIAASPLPNLPLIFSEYNATYANEPDITDSVFMGPWLADTISQCDGLTEAMMSYWTSPTSSKSRAWSRPFLWRLWRHAVDGIPKPAFNAFAMLHQLGDRRIKVDSDSAFATRSSDGTVAVALWNYAPPYGIGAAYTPPPANVGPSKTFTVTLTGASRNAKVQVWRLDADHGNVIKTYDAMGRPAFPTRDQITQLRAAGKPYPPENFALSDGKLTISILPQGLVLIKLSSCSCGCSLKLSHF